MSNVARLGDVYLCGDIQAEGSGNVFVNGLPVAYVGAFTAGHGSFAPVPIINGASSVYVNGKSIALKTISGHAGHRHHHSKHIRGTPIVTGSPDVKVE